jgi:hypothetical protein
MNKREIASLAIKLMGVFILLKSIAYVPMTLSVLFRSVLTAEGTGVLETMFAVAMSIVAAGVPLIFSLMIISLSDKAAARLIKDDQTIEKPDVSINKDDVMLVAISCIGLYFIIAATPMLIRGLGMYPMYPRGGMDYFGLTRFWTIAKQLIAPAVQIGLGIWLFAGSKGIVKLWKKIRS